MILSERKLAEIEDMFLQTTKPKVVISDYPEIKSFDCFYDNTPQGHNALKLATYYAKKFHLPLLVYAIADFYQAFKDMVSDMRNTGKEMLKYVTEYTKEKEVASDAELLIGGRIQKLIDLFDEELLEEEKLSYLMKEKLKTKQGHIVVVGSPMLRNDQEMGHFGYYLTKLLENREIHSNFLIVPDKLKGINDNVICFVNYEQPETSAVSLIRRSLSLNKDSKHLRIIGIITDKLIETVARSEQSESTDEHIDFAIVRERFRKKFDELLGSISINTDIKPKSFNYEIKIGVQSTIIKKILEEYDPKLVLIRNVTKLDSNLDSIALQMTQVVLSEGYPTLLVWD